jgi:hypothetical protein
LTDAYARPKIVLCGKTAIKEKAAAPTKAPAESVSYRKLYNPKLKL